MAGIFRFAANGDYDAGTSETITFAGTSTLPLDPAAATSFRIDFSPGYLAYKDPSSTSVFTLRTASFSFMRDFQGGVYLNFSDGTGAVTFGGGSWGDTLIGGSAGDRLDGAAGDDTLDGGDGNDTVIGGAGNDTMRGGRGDDMFSDIIGSNFIDGGEGNDTLSFDGGGRVVVDLSDGYSLQFQTDRYMINTFASIEDLIGSTNNDRLTGDSRGNEILGGDGADQIAGDAGNDWLYGQAGRDKLTGGDGNDRLFGNDSADTLSGGAGADRFVYNGLNDSGARNATRDHITDFSRAQGDKIDLSAIDAGPPGGSDERFKFVTAFSGDGGELRVTASDANWLVLADIDGDKKVDMSILVNAPVMLNASDFIL